MLTLFAGGRPAPELVEDETGQRPLPPLGEAPHGLWVQSGGA